MFISGEIVPRKGQFRIIIKKMNTLTKTTEDNLGGLLKMWAVPASVISLSGRSLTFSSTADIWELYRTPGKGSFVQRSVESRSGTHYELLIDGFAPSFSTEIMDAIAAMTARPYVIVMIDGNGQYILAGYNSSRYMRLSTTFDTGENESYLAGTRFVFSGKSTSVAVAIDDPFTSN
jgi:hypothetical protein